MQLKQIITQIQGEPTVIQLPKGNCNILVGNENKIETVFTIMRALLACDYTGELTPYVGLDKLLFDTESALVFTQGQIKVVKKAIDKEGSIPKIHLVEGNSDGSVTSMFLSDTFEAIVPHNLTASVESLTKGQQSELMERFNQFVGYPCMTIEDGEPQFQFDANTNIEEAKAAYMLFAESFTTPQDYLRIMLLHRQFYIEGDRLVSLLVSLKAITGLEMILCVADEQGLYVPQTIEKIVVQ